jgi:hypothetical protein
LGMDGKFGLKLGLFLNVHGAPLRYRH